LVEGAELMTKVGCGGHQVSLVGEWTRGERISVVFVCEGRLQREVKPKRLVKIMELVRRRRSDQATDAADSEQPGERDTDDHAQRQQNDQGPSALACRRRRIPPQPEVFGECLQHQVER
jgi:hypothetical protein